MMLLSKLLNVSGSRDSNPESLVPKTSMLAVTPHPDITKLYYHINFFEQCYNLTMKINDNYRFDQGYVMLPLVLPIGGLNKNIVLFGDTYHLKKEFHVSLLSTKNLTRKYSISEEESLDFFRGFTLSKDLINVHYLPEYRIATHVDGRKSIIQIVSIENYDLFFQELRKYFEIEIPTQPLHITIYTLDGGNGIGISSPEEMERTFKISFK